MQIQSWVLKVYMHKSYKMDLLHQAIKSTNGRGKFSFALYTLPAIIYNFRPQNNKLVSVLQHRREFMLRYSIKT